MANGVISMATASGIDANKGFSVKDFNFAAAGEGLGALLAFKQNKVNYKMKLENIAQQKDLNKLQFTEKQAMRALETNEFLSAVKANTARRGLMTGGETMQTAALNQATRQNASDTINFLNQERNLTYQQNVAKYEKKMADFSAAISLASSAASMAVSGGLL
jgi:hypothetical protein